MSSLGDIAKTYPAIGLIKAQQNNLKIDFLTYNEYKDLIEIFGVKVISVRREDLKGIYNILNTSFKIAKMRYEYVIDLHSVSRTIPITIACFFYGGKVTFVRKFAIRRRLSTLFHRYIFPPKRNVIFENIITVKRGLSPKYKIDINEIPRLKLENINKNKVKGLSIEELKKSITLSPFSSRNTKDLTVEQIYNIIKALNEIGIRPIVIGSWKDKQILLDPNEGQISYYNLIGKTNLNSFIYILYNTRATISVDSSALNIASIIGKPTVGIYGPTDPKLGLGVLKPTKSVSIELHCRPCSIHGSEKCKMRTRACIENIKTDTIIYALKELIDI
ncbi:MAG: glycosyltransferase family 9 protein [bacterium]